MSKLPKRRRSGNVHYGINLDTYYKNLDNMKLLVSYPEFNKEISIARKRLGIPDNGFSDKDQALIGKWAIERDEKSDRILSSKSFNEQEKRIKDKLFSGEIGMRIAQKQSDHLYNELPSNYLTNVCKFLTEKFRVPENYEDHIRIHILYGSINAPVNNFSIGPYPGLNSRSQVRYVPLKIYSQLTDDELKVLKKEIAFYGKHLPKFQTLKNIDKKLTLEQSMENRIKTDAVENTDYKMTVKEIAKDIFGNRKRIKRIYEIFDENKKLRERRFGKHI